MDIDYAKMRVDQVKECAAQSRWIFGAISAVSVSLACAVFNQMMSWDRQLAWVKTTTTTAGQLRSELLKRWVESHYVTLPIVGMRISANDASVLGCIVLAIISIWQYFIARRENQLIGTVIDEARDAPPAIAQYMRAGVSGSLVFATVTDDDRPFDETTGHAKTTKESPNKARRYFPSILAILEYIPVIVSVALVLSDFVSIPFPSPFREKNAPVSASFFSDPGKVADHITRILVNLVMLIVILWYVRRTVQFHGSTQRIVRNRNEAAVLAA